jgi:cytosine/adenosine deaminase-related metal-dependent hydrolase
MRLLWSLHAGWGFDNTLTTADVLRAALASGRPTLRAPGSGLIAPGEPADLLVLDQRASTRTPSPPSTRGAASSPAPARGTCGR